MAENHIAAFRFDSGCISDLSGILGHRYDADGTLYMERKLEAEAGRAFCWITLAEQKKGNVVFFIRIDKSLLKKDC